MSKQKGSILFLGKADDAYVEKAIAFCTANFDEVTTHVSGWGEPLPESVKSWEGDYIISYLSRWVVPQDLLEKAAIAAFNFHPASPDYPGIGCNNFALYESAKEYGVTCHHMAPTVDTGSIIAVKRFPIMDSDDVASILTRTYDYQLILFYEVLSAVLQGKGLPVSDEQWTRKPFSRKAFNELGKITPDMSRQEIANRIRATSYGPWQPTVTLQGFTFELKT